MLENGQEMVTAELLPSTLMNDENEGVLASTASVKSARRVLDLLEMLAATSQALGVSDVARKMGIPKSSAHMLLLTLEERNYVVDDGARRFRLNPMFSNNRSWVGGFRSVLLEVSRKIMNQLVSKLGETCFLAVLRESDEIEYIEKVLSPSEVRCDSELFVPRAIHSNSPGLVLMAYQSTEEITRYLATADFAARTGKTLTARSAVAQEIALTRRRGYATTSDTNTVGVSGVSAPVFGPHGQIVAALNISVPTSRYGKALKYLVADIVAGAHKLGAELSLLGGQVADQPDREPSDS